MAIFSIKHLYFEELLWFPSKHYVNNSNISKTLKDVSNTLQNFKFMGATVFEIAGGPADPLRLLKGVGTKRLGKRRVTVGYLIKRGAYFESRRNINIPFNS